MKKGNFSIALILIAILLMVTAADAQYYFGQNKIQYSTGRF